MRQSIAILVVLLACVTVHAAPPTTQPAPATQPAKAPALVKPHPDAKLLELPEYHAKIYLPRGWELQSESGPEMWQFRRTGAGDRPPRADFAFYVPPDPAGTLEAEVARARQRAGKDVAGVKFDRDEAVTLGGAPAWLLTYDDTFIPPHLRPRPGQKGPAPSPDRCMVIVGRYENVGVWVTFKAPKNQFDAAAKQLQPLLDAFGWGSGEPQVATVSQLQIVLPPTWQRHDRRGDGFPKHARVFRDSRTDTELALYSIAEPADVAAAIEKVRAEAAAKYAGSQTSEPVDVTMGAASGKAVVIDYQIPTTRLALQVVHAVFRQGDRTYHVVRKAPQQAIAKHKDAHDQVLATLNWAPAAAKPAQAPPAAGADQVAIEPEGMSARFLIPKRWKERQVNPQGWHYDMNNARGWSDGVLETEFLGQATRGELKAIVDEQKKIIRTYKDVKIVIDRAITLGGRPAWLIEFQCMVQDKVLDKNNKPRWIPNRGMEVICVDSEYGIAKFRYQDDSNTFDEVGNGQIQPVLNSFHWIEPE